MERKMRLIRRRNFPFGCMFEGVEVEGLFLVDCGEVRVWVTLGSGDCERADCPGWWGCGVPVGELGYVEHGSQGSVVIVTSVPGRVRAASSFIVSASSRSPS